MKQYNVTINVKQVYGSFVEADNQDEAVEKALEEWEELCMFNRDDLDIVCEEVYDDDEIWGFDGYGGN